MTKIDPQDETAAGGSSNPNSPNKDHHLTHESPGDPVPKPPLEEHKAASNGEPEEAK